MRVVLDTNILISACWKPGGLEDRVLELGCTGHFDIATSPQLWAEYREVLHRPKFAKLRTQIDHLLARLETKHLPFHPQITLAEARDEDDNRILECALASQASYIVTGNLKDFPAPWAHAQIVNSRQFLAAHNWLGAA
ncbi:putative toxin-antitoxin system toxin component, PIN family [Bryobacter aggregatus]|uniref:putative toxin-antitoxin system toxin component, PIN family n=1 Tax=Bryobacter aggregatus TaxID=360054 RepID=UPI000568E8AC|nr:putative toxin-antitoxin system toxin component, PIN family [Bryobacter aggregatus]